MRGPPHQRPARRAIEASVALVVFAASGCSGTAGVGADLADAAIPADRLALADVAPPPDAPAPGDARSRDVPAPSDAPADGRAPPTDAQPADAQPPPPSTQIASSAIGFVSIGGSRPGYEYGPSIVLVGDTYHAFYCAPAVSSGWDSIRRVTSKDGQSWSAPTVALEVYGQYAATAVCDPSVIRHQGVYLMYHTCINVSSPPDGYTNNRICVAAADAIGGPYHPYDQPVVEDNSCTSDYQQAYCVGQPSALVHGDQIYLYYSKANVGDPGPGAGAIYLDSSADGVNFSPAAGGTPVWQRRNVDVKRERSTGLFVLVQGEVDTTTLPWAISADGLVWSALDPASALAANPSLPAGGSNNNPGLAGDPAGTFDGMTFVLYGSSYDTGWGKWHLYRTDLIVDPAANDCSQCVAPTCDQACSQVLGQPSAGHCAAPGSSTPGNCCSCQPVAAEADCSGCAAGCVAACSAAGHQIGVCAKPGSTDPAACCACF